MKNIAIYYHERTKHHIDRLAKSLGYLDWANQPEPFRFYEGTKKIELPLLKEDPKCPYKALYDIRRCSFENFNVNTISKFLELSLGLSAWKSIPGSQWSLRMNPSSGNLHPTESYLIIPDYDGLKGIYHYNPFLHALEERALLPDKTVNKIRKHFKTDGFLVVLTSIFWREAWKYGERAYRYCQLDIGHAIAAITFSASLLGWRVKYLNAVGDEQIEKILGFHKTAWTEDEEEFPELVLFVFPKDVEDVPRSIPDDVVEEIGNLQFKGIPNKLSKEHVRWNVIYDVAEFVKKPKTEEIKFKLNKGEPLWIVDSKLSAPQIIRKRRSAVAYDRKTHIDKKTFIHMLDKTVPRKNFSPFDIEISNPSINLLLFIHRVHGLEKGLYFFFRYEEDKEQIIKKSRKEFLWNRVSDDTELYLLYPGDFEYTAKVVSCKQDIAGDSSFSLGMISKFKDVISKDSWMYRNIHWEAGMIGQVLYLEAEAHGVRGTGIGCFFDDLVHEILGLKDNDFQTLYHFTAGGHLEDTRLRTLPPYYYLEDVRKK